MSRTFAAFLLMLSAAIAFGDGMFAKLGSITLPTLPYQRALIAHRNGQETMVVESTLHGPEGDYAWIIPLPSPPTRILEVDPHWAERNTRSYGPQLAPFEAPNVALWLGGFLMLAGLAGAWNPSKRTSLRLFSLGWLALIATAFYFPVFAQSKSAAANSIETIKSMTVGAYKIEVVRSKNPTAMATWMRTHGGKLPDEAQQKVAEYVKEGWCFLVANLSSASGSGAPHPIAVTFSSAKAIYPMRLTGAQGNRVVVDLFVLADETATASPLLIWNSKRFPPNRLVKYDEDSFSYLPIETLAWSGCAVTHLRGEMGPEQMNRDITIGSRQFRAQVLKVGDREAFNRFAIYFVILASGFTAYLVALFAGLFNAQRKIAMLLTVVLAVATAGITATLFYSGVHPIESNLIAIDAGLDR